MKILLATHHLVEYGGTEQWTRTMCAALQRAGHTVDVFALQVGPSAHGLPLVAKPQPAYDLCLLNHRSIQQLAQHIDGVKIVTVHGPTHPLEKPLPGFDVYVAVSQEILNNLRAQRWPTIRLLNPIDTAHFAPAPPPVGPVQILSLCKGARARDWVAAACERLGYGFDWVHYKEKPCADVQPLIQAAHAVVSYGRGCYEALASGRHALVFDDRFVDGERVPFGDGWLTPTTMREIQWYNCSGRLNRTPWTADDVIYQLSQQYTALPNPAWGPHYIQQHQDADATAQAYLTLYQEQIHEQSQTADAAG